MSTDVSPDPLVGKQRLKSLLLGFLLPLHIMAEMGGLWVSIHEASIPGDSLRRAAFGVVPRTDRRDGPTRDTSLVRAPKMGNSRASSLNITTPTGKTARHCLSTTFASRHPAIRTL